MTVYITTNYRKKALYVGVTNNLGKRLALHYINRSRIRTFAGRRHCYYLLYFEHHRTRKCAVMRRKEVKRWNRQKKKNLVNAFNPSWEFLNSKVTEWPPQGEVIISCSKQP